MKFGFGFPWGKLVMLFLIVFILLFILIVYLDLKSLGYSTNTITGS